METALKIVVAAWIVCHVMACKHVEGIGASLSVQEMVVEVYGEKIELVFVERGKFLMGCTSEQGNDCEENETVHEEEVADFYIGKYEVTQRLWQVVMGDSLNRSYHLGCMDCPVENVSWREAQEFISRLNELTGKTFRLPSDTEWEYAARGGNESQGYKYSGSNDIDEVAWYVKNYEDSSPSFIKATHPVGMKKSNELGIYDMSGNVWEWCDNYYDKEYEVNGKKIHEGWPYPGMYPSFRRVLRGGSWGGTAEGCRVSYIDFDVETYDDEFGGFRLAMNVK